MRKTIIYPAILLFVVFFTSCALRTVMQINAHRGEIGRALPDTFRIELPLDRRDFHFFVQGKINNQYSVDFAIDNAADNILLQEDVDEIGAPFWKSVPVRTRNVYGQRNRPALHLIDSLQIGSLTFRQPYFTRLTTENALHETLSDIALEKGSERIGILGHGILPLLYWKFDLENEKMILFSNRDSALIAEETSGFTRIRNGIRSSLRGSLELDFPNIQESHNFIFDLGFNGEIRVDRRGFRKFSRRLPYRTIMVARSAGINEITYVFDNVDVNIGGFLVKNSHIVHSPLVNFNLIGNRFMQRFNFILGYGRPPYEIQGRGQAYRDLFIKPVANFDSIKSTPFVSALGFRFHNQGDSLIIGAIELGSAAEVAGLQLRDKVLSVDGGLYDLKNHTRERLVEYIANRESVIVKVRRNSEIIEIPINRLDN